IRSSSVELLDYTPGKPQETLLSPAGTITVFVGPKGAPLLDRLRKAVSTNNAAEEKTLADHIKAQFRGRKKVSNAQVWESLRAEPVLATIRYGGRTLATNVFVPTGLDLAVTMMPYNGGRIAPAQLTFLEHYKDGSSARLEAVAIRHMPPLS